ncbi:unnamed protein product [Moneuplotes crassus]|uniref:Uncharacterized protein n=2 Tax=Euplotes crassus TaxID=5936 RepID=A0AAD1U4K0_EUPCR|nr:unnamed protein product [Moneuplotes crassus]
MSDRPEIISHPESSENEELKAPEQQNSPTPNITKEITSNPDDLSQLTPKNSSPGSGTPSPSQSPKPFLNSPRSSQKSSPSKQQEIQEMLQENEEEPKSETPDKKSENDYQMPEEDKSEKSHGKEDDEKSEQYQVVQEMQEVSAEEDEDPQDDKDNNSNKSSTKKREIKEEEKQQEEQQEQIPESSTLENKKELKKPSFYQGKPHSDKKLAIKRQHPPEMSRKPYQPQDRSCFAPKPELKQVNIRYTASYPKRPAENYDWEKDQAENKQKKELIKEIEKEKEKSKIIVKDSVKSLIKKKLEANSLKKASGSILVYLEAALVKFYTKKLDSLKNIVNITEKMNEINQEYHKPTVKTSETFKWCDTEMICTNDMKSMLSQVDEKRNQINKEKRERVKELRELENQRTKNRKRGRKRARDLDEENKESDEDMDDDFDSGDDDNPNLKAPGLMKSGSKANMITSSNIFDHLFEGDNEKTRVDVAGPRMSTLEHFVNKNPSFNASKTTSDPTLLVKQDSFKSQNEPMKIIKEITIKRKHLVFMLENDPKYCNSNLLYNCYLG